MPGRAVHHADGEGQQVATSAGKPIVIKAGNEHTGGAYTLAEWEVEAGGGPPEHVHDYEDEAFYLVSGVVDVTVGDETFQARAGSYVFMPRSVPHAFRVVEDAKMLSIMSPAGFEQFLAARTAYLQEHGELSREVVLKLRAEHDERMAERAART